MNTLLSTPARDNERFDAMLSNEINEEKTKCSNWVKACVDCDRFPGRTHPHQHICHRLTKWQSKRHTSKCHFYANDFDCHSFAFAALHQFASWSMKAQRTMACVVYPIWLLAVVAVWADSTCVDNDIPTTLWISVSNDKRWWVLCERGRLTAHFVHDLRVPATSIIINGQQMYIKKEWRRERERERIKANHIIILYNNNKIH